MKMTALEMAQKYGWAKVIVSFAFNNVYCGHVTVEGQTRIIDISGGGSAVWVGTLALSFNAMVVVSEVAGGAEVRVHSSYQNANAA